ncbi:hypothetical protein LTR36_009604 [Oleoguttula mirabilis]|uniref:HCNGP-like protein n=1 Tax=Oleoguttula mirabilis TaxID=1507867 RepID=A0AAV9J5N5_9PEZI|nr:hypothetical protein LTR36_009604 [Oleoguttula mirabilis]
MSGLVAYASSDEDDDIAPERPAKIPKLNETGVKVANEAIGAQAQLVRPDDLEPAEPPYVPVTNANQPGIDTLGPAPGPSAVPLLPHSTAGSALTPSDPPLSPYTFERQRLRELTMPSIPNFDIPDSPSPPPTNSEEAAKLAVTTKKFERFLELKKQGVHFNERLQNSSSLRNPSLLPKLMDFAGISQEESYASALPEELRVPVKWAEESNVESLVKQNERREKKRLAERDKVDFVPAAKSGGSSVTTTPAAGGGSVSKEGKRSRFDKR